MSKDWLLQALTDPTLRLFLSKALGYSMTIGACFYKLPIMLNIWKAGNCEGLSPLSLYLETSAFLASLVYNINRENPFSTYGDIAAISIQLFVLIAMVWTMGINKQRERLPLNHIVLVFSLFISFTYAIVFVIPTDFSSNLMIYSIVVSLCSKLPQILKNFQEKDTGVQSMITALNAILGPIAKIYITLIETKDIFILIYSCLSFLLNLLILTQIMIYSKTKRD